MDSNRHPYAKAIVLTFLHLAICSFDDYRRGTAMCSKSGNRFIFCMSSKCQILSLLESDPFPLSVYMLEELLP